MNRPRPRPRPLLGFAIAAAATASLAGCGGTGSAGATTTPQSSNAAQTTATGQPVAITGCGRSLLPHGFAVDRAHSGTLTAHTYSQSADVQAALEYDQLSSGARRVWLRHSGGAASPVTDVVSCVALRFATPHLANRFLLSYDALRDGAKQVATRIAGFPSAPGLTSTVAYRERQQSFRGYHIASTDVVEAAGQSGPTLSIVSVAGRAPSARLAHSLLVSAVGR